MNFLHEDMLRLYGTLDPPLDSRRGVMIEFIAPNPGAGTSTVARAFAEVASRFCEGVTLLFDLSGPANTQYNMASYERLWGGGSLSAHIDLGFNPNHMWRLLSDTAGLDGSHRVPPYLLTTFHQLDGSRLFLNRFGHEALQFGQRAQINVDSQIWQMLRAHVPLTIFDAPPTSVSSDGVSLAPEMDAVVIVVEAETERSAVIEDLRDKLIARGAHIAGIVFNKRRFHIPEQVYRWL
jgi:hypothetical protein